ncbi:MAG TPA: cupin domain-containing protein [Candidatus Binatia bacterium]|nr:cupin domain-containing protein [Candidatus Binatia bacterium]
MFVEVKNIFADLPQQIGAENFFRLFQSRSTNIERIVSHSHCSPPDFWYDQPEDEWVIVLRGHATLDFEAGGSVELKAGDYVTSPRHVRHRVARTSEETLWLAVHSK